MLAYYYVSLKACLLSSIGLASHLAAVMCQYLVTTPHNTLLFILVSNYSLISEHTNVSMLANY